MPLFFLKNEPFSSYRSNREIKNFTFLWLALLPETGCREILVLALSCWYLKWSLQNFNSFKCPYFFLKMNHSQVIAQTVKLIISFENKNWHGWGIRNKNGPVDGEFGTKLVPRGGDFDLARGGVGKNWTIHKSASPGGGRWARRAKVGRVQESCWEAITGHWNCPFIKIFRYRGG